MADVELVIKMPEIEYEHLTNKEKFYSLEKSKREWLINKTLIRVINGVSLPEGHGRIGDLDKLEKEMANGIKAGLMIEGYEKYPNINDMDDCLECVRYADTIIEANCETQLDCPIEADKEDEERK